MTGLLGRLEAAHVQHELRRFAGPPLRKALREEIDAALAWARRVRLDELVSSAQVIGFVRRNLIEPPVTGGLAEWAGEMSRIVLASRHNRDATLGDIFARPSFDGVVDKLVALTNVRTALVRGLVRSAAFEALLADLAGELLGRWADAAGVRRLVEGGRKALERAAPALGAAARRGGRAAMRAPMTRLARRSEAFLSEFLAGDRLADLAESLWDAIAHVPLSRHFAAIDADDMEDFVIIGIEFWQHFRRTPYFARITAELIESFFAKYGRERLEVLLEDVGLSRAVLVREMVELLLPTIEQAVAAGYVEQRIRARLADFYRSPAAAALVGRPGARRGSAAARRRPAAAPGR